MNKYTIKDYESYLDMENGMFPYQVPLWKTNRIDESKGIVDDYLPIVNELYEELLKERPILFDGDEFYLSYALVNYKFKEEDVFMANCDLILFTKSNGSSNFNGRDAKISIDDNKMLDAKFIIRIENKLLDDENGKREFYETMAHELQHAYRFYNIFLSNNSYQDEEINKMKRYERALNNASNSKRLIDYNVNNIYYLSERNEISSEANRLFEYLRQHEEINESNVEEYQNNLPLFITKINLEAFLSEMDTKLQEDEKEYVDYIGELFKKIIGDEKMTPSRAFIKFRTRIVDATMFANKLYKRTLSKAFEDFNRKRKAINADELAREMVETK